MERRGAEDVLVEENCSRKAFAEEAAEEDSVLTVVSTAAAGAAAGRATAGDEAVADRAGTHYTSPDAQQQHRTCIWTVTPPQGHAYIPRTHYATVAARAGKQVKMPLMRLYMQTLRSLSSETSLPYG